MEEYNGFQMPDQEFTKVTNDFFEIMAQIDSFAELKVLLYVMRHTWGYQEYDTFKHITIDEFVHGRKLRNGDRMDGGTGLSDTAVKDGIRKAIAHGYLECERDEHDRGRVKKSFRLKMREDSQPARTNPEESEQKPKSRIEELRTMPYAEYLQSPEWTAKRKKALRFAGYRCQLCNSNENLNVHHRTYERRGQELMGDLTVLCADCHTTFTYNRELAQ